MPCEHKKLTYKSSAHATTVRFPYRTRAQLSKAAGEKLSQEGPAGIWRIPREEYEALRKNDPPSIDYNETFPAPLVLPGDELAEDPKYPPQSYRNWQSDKSRNKIDRGDGGRNTIYVCRPPDIQGNLKQTMGNWATFRPPGKRRQGSTHATKDVPKTGDVIEYLSAFYHGIPVKELSSPDGGAPLTFAKWDVNGDGEGSSSHQPSKSRSRSKAQAPAKASSKAVPSAIALCTSNEAIRIRIRERKNDIYPVQLNLNDLLDVAIEILPEDAYALLMLVEHDLYEDDEDDFACGRAYGGSRVAVVSMARYHPDADEIQGVDREHAWPASHCKVFLGRAVREGEEGAASVEESLEDEEDPVQLAIYQQNAEQGMFPPQTALESAVEHYIHALEISPQFPSFDKMVLWLGRVCRTASHELGHCFGLDHCVYYACVMQGTASIVEDARQPMYLCPVDETKLKQELQFDRERRYEELQDFCMTFGGGGIFEGFRGWLEVRIAEVTGEMAGTAMVPDDEEGKGVKF